MSDPNSSVIRNSVIAPLAAYTSLRHDSRDDATIIRLPYNRAQDSRDTVEGIGYPTARPPEILLRYPTTYSYHSAYCDFKRGKAATMRTSPVLRDLDSSLRTTTGSEQSSFIQPSRLLVPRSPRQGVPGTCRPKAPNGGGPQLAAVPLVKIPSVR